MVMKQSKNESEKGLRERKRELEQSEARVQKLDGIIQKLYEDNLDGKISDDRFAKMSANYEAEQKALEATALASSLHLAALSKEKRHSR